MAKKKTENAIPLDELVESYDEVRAKLKPLEKEKDALSQAIKSQLGQRESAEVPGYTVTYAYDADKQVVTFDKEKLETEDPELLKKLVKKGYVTLETKKGNRRLVIDRLEKE